MEPYWLQKFSLFIPICICNCAKTFLHAGNYWLCEQILISNCLALLMLLLVIRSTTKLELVIGIYYWHLKQENKKVSDLFCTNRCNTKLVEGWMTVYQGGNDNYHWSYHTHAAAAIVRWQHFSLRSNFFVSCCHWIDFLLCPLLHCQQVRAGLIFKSIVVHQMITLYNDICTNDT